MESSIYKDLNISLKMDDPEGGFKLPNLTSALFEIL